MVKDITKKFISAILAVCFCLICMINITIPKTEFSETENRYLSSFPKASLESIKSGEFMQGFEKYTTDQFMMREFFISLKAKLEKLLFRKENNGVYFAEDNYLIEKPAQFDEKRINENLNSILKLKNMKRYNITISLVPGAYEILKDKLPKNAYSPYVPETISYIKSYLQNSGINYSDPTSILELNRDKYLYYKTDHHQTTSGAYLVYSNLGEALGYTPKAKEEFDITTVSDSFLGTTWSKAMVNKKSADTIETYTPKVNNKFFIEFPFENKNMHSLYNENHLSKKDKYSYFLDGNHGLSVVDSLNKNGKELMVIKDSYAHNIVPFMANHYEKIHTVDLRYFNQDIIEYLHTNEITDILFLYSLSGFAEDTNISKLYSWCENSPYAKNPFGLVYESETVSDNYFNDAVFIGDSLTEGLRLYNSLNEKQFLSYIGMSLYGINNRKFPDATGTPMYSVIDMIVPMDATKFYIMVGTNDHISPEALENYINNYSRFIDDLQKYKPNSTIYLQSILPVTEEKQLEGRFKNEYIYMYNDAIKNLAKEKNCYYLNIAEMCSDENGALISDISPDGIHLNITYYKKWFEYLKNHAIGGGEVSQNSIEIPETPVIPTSENTTKIAEDLKNNVPFTDLLWQIDNSVGVSLYGVDASMVKSATIYAGSGATAEEIAVFEYNNQQDVENIKNCIYKHLQDRKGGFENYLPSEVSKLSNPYIKVTDKYIVLCVSDYNEKADEILKKYTNIQ